MGTLMVLLQICTIATVTTSFTLSSSVLNTNTHTGTRTRTRLIDSASLTVRRASIQDNKEQDAAADAPSVRPQLFDIDDIDESAFTYRVKDMSSFQEEIEESSMGMDYSIEYDLEDDNQNYNHDKGVIDVITEDASFEYVRDEDDILTERESRLYVDESGQAALREKCILIGVEDLSARYKDRKMQRSKNPEEWEVYFNLEQSMDEMRELIDTSGLELAGEVTQRMNEVNPKTYIGTGKVKEAQELMDEIGDCCTVVFDAELSPGQQKTLENIFNKEIIQNDFLGSESLVSMHMFESGWGLRGLSVVSFFFFLTHSVCK